MLNRLPHEREFQIKPIGVKYICEFCNDGEMIVDPTGPINHDIGIPLFPHKCNKCHKTLNLPKQYPYVDWVQIDGGDNNESN